jgi:hypothetical protein
MSNPSSQISTRPPPNEIKQLWLLAIIGLGVTGLAYGHIVPSLAVQFYPEQTQQWTIAIFGEGGKYAEALTAGGLRGTVKNLPAKTLVGVIHHSEFEQLVNKVAGSMVPVKEEVSIIFTYAENLTHIFQQNSGLLARYIPVCFQEAGRPVPPVAFSGKMVITGEQAANLLRFRAELSGRAPKSGASNDLTPCLG